MRPSRNWAKFTVKPGQTGTIQPFDVTAANRYAKGKDPKAPSNASFIIQRIIVHGSPSTDPAAVQKAVSGAVMTLEGQGGKKIELGPMFTRTKECNPWTSDEMYELEVPIAIPPASDYNIVISYEQPPALADTDSPVDLFVVVEGVEK
ncbi:hypothetical protein [Desulfurobacterium sp.]